MYSFLTHDRSVITNSRVINGAYPKNSIKVQVDTPTILNNKQRRKFWISWRNGIIKVGRGEVYDDDVFMKWQDPDFHDVNGIAFYTGWGASGIWRIVEPNGRIFNEMHCLTYIGQNVC